MLIEFHGLIFQTPSVTVHLWSPWRSTALEHRLFDSVRDQVKIQVERGSDEYRMRLTDPKQCRAAIQCVSRVLKGWQEEADPHTERRVWWWLFEGDTDANGYDHTGEPTSILCFVRVGIERGGVDQAEKAEDIDLDGFGFRIWGEKTK